MTSRFRPAAVAFVVTSGVHAASACLVAGLVALGQAMSPPPCHGLGWGCVPSPLAAASNYVVFAVAPAMLMLAAPLLITAALPTDRARRHASSAVASLACALALVTPVSTVAAYLR